MVSDRKLARPQCVQRTTTLVECGAESGDRRPWGVNVTSIILDTGLLAEATLTEGAGWIAGQNFSARSQMDANPTLETNLKGFACFKLLDQFTRLSARDRAHTDALAALRAGFVEHSLSSANTVEWESILSNVLYLLQLGSDYAGSEAHINEVARDAGRTDRDLTAESASRVFADTASVVDARIAHLFEGFEIAA